MARGNDDHGSHRGPHDVFVRLAEEPAVTCMDGVMAGVAQEAATRAEGSRGSPRLTRCVVAKLLLVA
jgi:hypothetical protein